jgi:hypothetical protein
MNAFSFFQVFSALPFSILRLRIAFFLVAKGPAADATDALQPWGLLCNPVMKMMMIIFSPVEWNWQGKTKALGEKHVPVPLCPPQIPHGLTRDRTRASAVGGRRLTTWAMALPTVYLPEAALRHRLHTERWVPPTNAQQQTTLAATCCYQWPRS